MTRTQSRCAAAAQEVSADCVTSIVVLNGERRVALDVHANGARWMVGKLPYTCVLAGD